MNEPTRTSLLRFYATPPHPCGYLPQRQATTLFADPAVPKTTALYSLLSAHGFRRSGGHLYRPHCHPCHACIPVRLPVREFRMKRHQQRTWDKNQDLVVTERSPIYDPEHYALYQRYLKHRHPGGGMDDGDVRHYTEFLTAAWVDTRFLEMRIEGRLVCVAVVDVLEDALSAVYTYFDPDLPTRGLGKYAVLYEIAQTRERELSWLYLGYWIKDCRKMSYKHDYQPLEYLWDGRWTPECPTTG